MNVNVIICSVHNDYPDDCKPKRGRKYALQTVDELDIVNYTNFCWEMNFPKTQKMLKPDIALHIRVEGLENKFKYAEPGEYICIFQPKIIM